MPNHFLIATETAISTPTEWATQAAQTLKTLPVESVLLPLLTQVALIILVARLFAILFRKLGQPTTVGEIAAGLVIGPSVLGKLAPDLFQSIFHPTLEGVPADRCIDHVHRVLGFREIDSLRDRDFARRAEGHQVDRRRGLSLGRRSG